MANKIFFKSILFFVAIIAIGAQFVSAQKADNSYKDMAVEVLRYINKHRTEMRLKPLVMNNVISKIASEHSVNMGEKKVPFGHQGMDDRVARANKELKQHASAWAENIASGQNTAKGVVEMWLKSQGHRENIEGDYNQTGIGIAKGSDGSLYFTQIFIRKSK